MIIGVDVDEVLFPLKKDFYNYLNEKFGWELDWKTQSYRFGEDWGASMDEGTELYTEFTKTSGFKEMAPLAGAVEGMNALKELSKEIYAITSRQDFLKGATEDSLKKHFPGVVSGVEMGNHFNTITGGKTFSKRELCTKRNVKLFVEDQAKYAEELSKIMPVILIDQPWNQGFEAENVHRAKSWAEVVEIVKKLVG